MRKHHKPIRIKKENHLKLIIVLLVTVIVLVWVSRSCVPVFRSENPSVVATRESESPPKSTESTSLHQDKNAARTASPAVPNFEKRSGTGGRHAGRIEYLERPACRGTEFLLVHSDGRYALWYDTTYRQAAWVAYLLTRKDVRAPGVKRANRFRRDPEVLRKGWPSASDADYKGGPFDRGHLLPSADRRASFSENHTTFYFSNISPQYPALNRGVWKNLEEQVRRWADRFDSLYVVTGPELVAGLDRRPGGVGVPRRYFKALLVCRNDRCEALAFLIPNAPELRADFMSYAMSVDELEAALGYDFFYRLPDSLENRVESRIDPSFWR